MENDLKKERYIEVVKENNKTYYKITSKGKKLLTGQISFLSAYVSKIVKLDQVESLSSYN